MLVTLCLFSRLLKILEGGLVEHFKARWFTNSHGCHSGTLVKAHTKISLSEAEGAFYFLGFGLALASVVLLAESCRRRYGLRSEDIGDNRDTSHLPTTASTKCELTSVWADGEYTYSANSFDYNSWSADEWKHRYNCNSFMSSFDILDLAPSMALQRERCSSNHETNFNRTLANRSRFNRDRHRNSMPDLSKQLDNGCIQESRIDLHKCQLSSSVVNCTDVETGEFSVEFACSKL